MVSIALARLTCVAAQDARPLPRATGRGGGVSAGPAEEDRAGLLGLIYADYRAHYYHRAEGRRRLALLALPRMLVNPSLHATILIRICLAGPRALFFVGRNLLIAKHSIELGLDCHIGPGFNLPHPLGIVIGNRTTIGADVMLYHNVTLGTRRAPQPRQILGVPTIEDGVVVYPNAVIAGPVTVGFSSVVGANCFIGRDVAPCSVIRPGMSTHWSDQ